MCIIAKNCKFPKLTFSCMPSRPQTIIKIKDYPEPNSQEYFKTSLTFNLIICTLSLCDLKKHSFITIISDNIRQRSLSSTTNEMDNSKYRMKSILPTSG